MKKVLVTIEGEAQLAETIMSEVAALLDSIKVNYNGNRFPGSRTEEEHDRGLFALQSGDVIVTVLVKVPS